MANNNQGSDQNGYAIPDLSSILATLAQFAPQQPATSHLQQAPYPPSGSTTPPGGPSLSGAASINNSNFNNNSIFQSLIQPATSSTPISADRPHAQLQPLIPQDPRLLGRSRTHTPDLNTLSAQSQSLSLPGLGGLQTAQPSYSVAQTSSHPQFQQQYVQAQPDLSLYPQQSHVTTDPRLALQQRKAGGQAQPQAQSQSQVQAGFVIDPATITEWTAGLRCVNKIAAQNREFAAAIKRMITNQQKHEMQWYQGRQELKQMQARRATGANEIHNILSSLGTHPSITPAEPAPQQTPEEKQAELTAFDQKIYRAQLAMQDNMTAELKALGVPFFGTNADRLVPDDDPGEDGGGIRGAEGQPKWSPRITKKELLGLQRKILGFLEDMYKE